MRNKRLITTLRICIFETDLRSVLTAYDDGIPIDDDGDDDDDIVLPTGM